MWSEWSQACVCGEMLHINTACLMQSSAHNAQSDMMIEKKRALDNKVKDIKSKVQVRTSR